MEVCFEGRESVKAVRRSNLTNNSIDRQSLQSRSFWNLQNLLTHVDHSNLRSVLLQTPNTVPPILIDFTSPKSLFSAVPPIL